MSCQFSWAVIPGTDQASASGSSDDVRDWLEPGESWFCEEHYQIALAPEDIPEGYEQICLECNPEVLSLASVSPFATESDAQALFPSGVAYAQAGTREKPTSWTNAGTLIGEDQSIIYSVPSTGDYTYFRLVFSSVQSPSGSFVWFYSSTNFTNSGSVRLRFSSSATAWYQMTNFSSVSFTSVQSSQTPFVFSGSLSTTALTANTYYFGSVGSGSTWYIGKFYISSEGYTGDGTGSGGSGGSEPEQPGFDDPDGWLGGLIDSIIEGINTVIEGISNVAQNIASLPSNIAGALSGFFQQVVSAVTSIGDQITNALTTLGNFLIDGLKQLFIPSDGYFESVANDLSTFFSDRLGLLLYPFEFLVSLGDRIAGLETSEPTCTIPEIAYTDSDDNKYVLIEGQTLNVYDLVGRNDIIVGMHQTYLTVMDGIIAFTLMALCWKRFDHIIGGGAE